MWYVVKLVLSAVLIVAVSEVAKRSAMLGGLIASLPLISFLGFIWLYVDTINTDPEKLPADTTAMQLAVQRISDLSWSILWLVVPSLALFVALPLLLKKMPFIAALPVATLIMFGCYGLTIAIVRQFGGQA